MLGAVMNDSERITCPDVEGGDPPCWAHLFEDPDADDADREEPRPAAG
jgi:hypothetical protein